MSIPEIDLHGLTREEALAEVDRELNHTFIQETLDRRLRFITGWGEVVRPAVQQYLSEHVLVKELRLSGASIEITLEDL
jgi:DNA-nicking Smr family endonuclease